MSEPESFTVPKGDPVFSIFIWRADSITLTRLRPVLEWVSELASGSKCENFFTGTCEQDRARSFDTGESATSYCWPCRLRVIAARIGAVA